MRDAFVHEYRHILAKHRGSRPLIRINTDDLDSLTQDGLNEFVMNLLVAHGISASADLAGFVPPHNTSWQQYGTARNRAAAAAKGCSYLEQPYLGVNQKYRFGCAVHGEFTMTGKQMRASLGGCLKCGWLRQAASRARARKPAPVTCQPG
jgi:hypothetical protein